MKKLSETANHIIDAGDITDPEAMKFDIQVRTGGGGLPPRWFMPLADDRDIGASEKKIARSTKASGDIP